MPCHQAEHDESVELQDVKASSSKLMQNKENKCSTDGKTGAAENKTNVALMVKQVLPKTKLMLH
jgi:hypothetical protein